MRFKGIIPALVTPLDEKENVKTEVLAQLMRDLIAQGADGFYIGGATERAWPCARPSERD